MWLKSLLGALFLLSLAGAFIFAPEAENGHNHEGHANIRVENDRRLRLLSWNIGNGDLESESRAHSEDLPAVAKVILDNDVDAVALQELTGKEQLKLLLTYLNDGYDGQVASPGNGDRVEAVLVRKASAQIKNGRNREGRGEANVNFSDVPASDRFAAAASFGLGNDSPEVLFLSAHADAFSASRRRAFAEAATDWARDHGKSELAFIAGDFNFEVSTRNRNNLFTDDAKHDSEAYAYLLKYFRDLGADAGETSINDRRIDYVFGPVTSVTLHRAVVLRSASVGRMDHWPLLVEVGF